jgi:hypothetical protein
MGEMRDVRDGRNNFQICVTKINSLPSCAWCKIRTIVKVRFIRQRRLALMALLGLALARSPVHLPPPPENITACQLDDLGVANYKSDIK